MTEAERFPWMRAPALIAGRWRAPELPTCNSAGMVVAIEVSAEQPRVATGRLVSTGAASKLGYRKGEVIMQLEANDYGNWPGKIKWRSVRGDERWDPVHFVLEGAVLKGTMSGGNCWDLTRQ